MLELRKEPTKVQYMPQYLPGMKIKSMKEPPKLQSLEPTSESSRELLQLEFQKLLESSSLQSS